MADKIILLVEDNPDDELLTLRAFKKTNFKNDIHIVRDGQEAMDYLKVEGKYAGRNPDEIPELILLDINLPKISGLDILKYIKSDGKYKTTPTVMLTTSKEDEDLFKSYSLGANSFVKKPIDFNEFLEKCAQIGNYWLLVNEPLRVRMDK